MSFVPSLLASAIVSCLAFDSSGQENPPPTPCLLGGFLALSGLDPHDGTASGASLPDHDSLENPSGITIDVRFWPRTMTYTRLVSKSDGLGEASDRSYDLSLLQDGRIEIAFFLGSVGTGNWVHLVSSTVVDSHLWRRATATFDSEIGEARLYVDGMLDSATTLDVAGKPIAGTSLRASTRPFFVGATPEYPSTSFDGAIDEVRVWSRALTGPEVFKAGTSSFGPQEGLVAFLAFDGHLYDLASIQLAKKYGTAQVSGPCAHSVKYGAGVGGANGSPELSASTLPFVGSVLGLELTNPGLAPGVAVLVVGIAPAKVPVYAGHLSVNALAFATIGIGGAGITIPALVPADPALSGLAVFMQAIVSSSAAPAPVGLTRGLALQIGLP